METNQFSIIEIALTSQIRCVAMSAQNGVAHISQQARQNH